jgi:hypothetical protein
MSGGHVLVYTCDDVAIDIMMVIDFSSMLIQFKGIDDAVRVHLGLAWRGAAAPCEPRLFQFFCMRATAGSEP